MAINPIFNVPINHMVIPFLLNPINRKFHVHPNIAWSNPIFKCAWPKKWFKTLHIALPRLSWSQGPHINHESWTYRVLVWSSETDSWWWSDRCIPPTILRRSGIRKRPGVRTDDNRPTTKIRPSLWDPWGSWTGWCPSELNRDWLVRL